MTRNDKEYDDKTLLRLLGKFDAQNQMHVTIYKSRLVRNLSLSSKKFKLTAIHLSTCFSSIRPLLV
jgi:hypothetical protein